MASNPKPTRWSPPIINPKSLLIVRCDKKREIYEYVGRDGTRIVRDHKNGTVEVHYPGGLVIKRSRDGKLTGAIPNGETLEATRRMARDEQGNLYAWYGFDGCEVRVYPDGTTEVHYYLAGRISKVTYVPYGNNTCVVLIDGHHISSGFTTVTIWPHGKVHVSRHLLGLYEIWDHDNGVVWYRRSEDEDWQRMTMYGYLQGGNEYPGYFPWPPVISGSYRGCFIYDSHDLYEDAKKGPAEEKLHDPLVLDLDGDGIETTSLEYCACFDHNGDGFAERTGWVGPDDGLLVMDRNGDGLINDGGELFSDHTVLSDGTKAASGFEALAQFDDNMDGSIDATDEVFSYLRVWIDSNGDGWSSPGELFTLDDLGIKSISLDSSPEGIVDPQGNTLDRIGSFEFTDGSTGQIGEYSLQSDAMVTTANEWLDVPEDIAALPDLTGYGVVYDLHQAMVRDTPGDLQSLVEQFVAADNQGVREQLMQQILFAWAGDQRMPSEESTPAQLSETSGSGGTSTTVTRSGGSISVSSGPLLEDQRKLAVLEHFMGERWNGSLTYGASVLLQQAYSLLFEMMYAGLMAQTHLSELYDKIVYTWDEETQEVTTGFTGVVPEIVAALDDDPAAGKELLSEFARSLRGISSCSTDCYLTFREHMLEIDPELGWVFDTGGLPVYQETHLGVRAWSPHIEGTDKAEAILGSLTRGDGWLNALHGDGDVIYGTDRDERLVQGSGGSVLVAGGGDDIIWAGDGADILDGGAGTDVLYGESGDDTYILRIGSGNDTIIDVDATEGNVDTIFIGSSLTPDQISLKRVGNGLVVEIVGTSDSMTVRDFFRNDSTLNRVEQIQFMDGTVWTETEIIAWTYTPTDGDDVIYGSPGEDELSGLAGNDVIVGMESNDTLYGDEDNDLLYGGAGSDVLEGGSGADRLFGEDDADVLIGGLDNDFLDGGTGNDVYRFNRGDGHDIIDDADTTAGNTDTLELGEGILPNDVQIQRMGNDLKLTILDTGDTVTVKDWLVNDTAVHGIELISFADGTMWDTATIQDMLVKGTEEADTIIGFSGADNIEGFGSDDTLYGRGGDDTITSGSGADALFGEGGDDVLIAGDQNDTLVGGSGSDILDPGAGNDALFGGDTATWSGSVETNGNDRYVFGTGYGHDVILDHDRSAGNIDTIQLADGITVDDVQVYRDGENLVLSLNDGADTLIVEQWFWNDSPEYRVEVIQFADGTTWDVDTVKEMVLQATDGDDVLIGTSISDTLNGYGGNDRIYGRADADVLDGGSGDDQIAGEAGDDLLLGRDGADVLSGGSGDDTLDAGAGADVLYGGTDHDWYGHRESNGNDTFLFGRGSGQDTVTDYDATAGNLDTILLNDDVLPADVSIRRVDDNLVLSISGTDDTLTVSNWFVDESGTWQVEQIQFADGTLWNAADIKQMVLQGTPEDDLLIGYSTDDTITGLAGADTIYGNAGADTIDPGAGDDYAEGGTGNDVYVFGRGSGNDTVVDYDDTAGNVDTIALAADVLPSDVTLEIDETNLRIVIAGTNDTLLVTGWFADDASKVERIVFDDGTVWDTQYIQDNARSENVILGTPDNDALVGTDREDTLIGLQGNERLEPQPNGDCRHRRHARAWVSQVPSYYAGDPHDVSGLLAPGVLKPQSRRRFAKDSSRYDKKMRITTREIKENNNSSQWSPCLCC